MCIIGIKYINGTVIAAAMAVYQNKYIKRRDLAISVAYTVDSLSRVVKSFKRWDSSDHSLLIVSTLQRGEGKIIRIDCWKLCQSLTMLRHLKCSSAKSRIVLL